MATYAASTALAFDYNAANGTTGSFTPSGSDIAVLAMVSSIEFGSKTINLCRYPNSSGTDLTRIGSDYSWNSTACLSALWEGVGIPASSTTLYSGWAASYLQSAIAGVAYSGVDQTTPFSGGVDNSGLVTSVTTTVASVTVTGCTAGQTIVAMVAANADNVTLSAFTAVSGTTIRASDVTGTYLGVAVLEKVATGSSETLSVNVNCGSSAILSWAARGIRVNDAAGGGSTGTVAYTNANDTSAASGTTTVTGSLARTNANDSSAASGTTTVTGTLARTNANDTSSASGTTTVTGTLARTNANDTSSASGSVGGGSSGTLAYTNANDTPSASGTTTVIGTLARTNANDSVSASGAAGVVSGTVAVTNRDDTATAEGRGAPATGGGGGGKKRKRIFTISGIRFVGTQEEFDRLTKKTFEDARVEEEIETPAIPMPVVAVDDGQAFERAAAKLDEALAGSMKKIEAAQKQRQDDEDLELLLLVEMGTR